MAAFLSALLGILTAGIPKLIDMFQDRADKKHELALADLHAKNAAADRLSRLEELRAMAESNAEAISLAGAYAPPPRMGNKIVDAANALVRPVYAYWVLLLYTVIKSTVVYYAFKLNVGYGTFVAMVWNPLDEMILSAIIGYFFTARALKKNDDKKLLGP